MKANTPSWKPIQRKSPLCPLGKACLWPASGSAVRRCRSLAVTQPQSQEKTHLQSLGACLAVGVLVSPSFWWLLATPGLHHSNPFAATWHSSYVHLYIATFLINTSHITSGPHPPQLPAPTNSIGNGFSSRSHHIWRPGGENSSMSF